MFLPTYSSELNPIERLWSLLKKKWAQGLFHFSEELSNMRASRKKDTTTRKTIEKIRELISKLKILNGIVSIEKQTVVSIARSHFKAILGVLEGNLV
jgi:transposase